MQQDDTKETAASTKLSAEQVTSYLRSHPHFFEQQASLLAEIYLPSPHGNGAISLAERQQLAQRDKIRTLEVKLADLISFAEENDATSKKVHELSVQLLATQSFVEIQELVTRSLQQEFSVSKAALHIWLNPLDAELKNNDAFASVSDTFSDWVLSLSSPFCGAKPPEAEGVVASDLQSFAFIPLRKKTVPNAFGVLVLAADTPQRFKANMGTMYLERIGELVSVALLCHI